MMMRKESTKNDIPRNYASTPWQMETMNANCTELRDKMNAIDAKFERLCGTMNELFRGVQVIKNHILPPLPLDV
ncbi:hypothetical protein SLEP1_g36898 [Rubroshorea leprosula]|nr:hypothetical protein SLEP1_g36898 [Rubroshorea leprosula]